MAARLITGLLIIFVLFASIANGQPISQGKGVYRPPAVKGETVLIWERFNQQFENKWKVEWNPATGTPHRISGHYLNVPQMLTNENVASVALGIVRQYRDVLQADPDNIVLSSADFSPSKSARSEGTWYIQLQQTYHAIPVEGGGVRLVVRNQKVTTLGSDVYPHVEAPVQPSVALDKAVRTVNLDSGQKPESKPVMTKLVILPRPQGDSIRYSLAWKILTQVVHVPKEEVLPAPGRGPLQGKSRPGRDGGSALVPAQWMYYVDASTGVVISRRNVMVYEQVSGHVVGLVHPLVAADTPVPTPINHLRVTITQGSSTVHADTDASGNYVITGLTTAPASLESHFENDSIKMANGEGPTASHTASVTLTTTHDWNWGTYDASPNDVETNVFYHVNKIRDWYLHGDPFNVSVASQMNVTVRDGAYCNAGSSGAYLAFGSGAPGCSDYGLCADIVYHEYTHSIVGVVYAATPITDYSVFSAMNEAWADFFAVNITGNPEQAAGCAAPGMDRNIDTPDKRWPDDVVDDPHLTGMIFSGALWDLRTALGANYVVPLAMYAMKNHATNFSDYLAAVLDEDDDNGDLSDGTPNIDAICHAYYDLHGIYYSPCSGHTEMPIALITSPAPLTYNFFNGTTLSISIVGTAHGSATSPSQKFVLEYAAGEGPSSWSSTGFTLTGGGNTPVADALLGTWNIAGIGDGLYTVRLTVTDAASQTSTFSVKVVIDRLMKSGWPQKTSIHFVSSPAVGDIDKAYSGLEVVAAADDWYLYVLHSDGTDAPGWPQFIGYTASSPAIGDIDNDGELEIVIATKAQVYAFRHDGTWVAGWPKAFSSNAFTPTPALGDLDHDGNLEIIIGSTDHNVYAWHHDGNPVAGWPQTTGGEVNSSAALGDIDQDGNLEIVIGSNDNKVYAWHYDGTPVNGWPQATGDEVQASPVLGDINNDGYLEVLVSSGPQDGKIYAWSHDGNTLVNWPQNFGGASYPSSPVLSDIDGDGQIEVIAKNGRNNIHVWKGDGTPVTGWPPVDGPGAYGTWVQTSPVLGDIDGDTDIEIVAEGPDITSEHKLFAFHPNGTGVTGWPRVVIGYSNSSPAIADIDMDGRVEIITGSKGIFVWDLASAYNERSMEWPFYRHDVRRTGTYGPRSAVVLLFDTSGSMSWSYDGTVGVPVAEQRLTLAKEAAYPFIEMLNDFNSGKANFGIATFPAHPASYPWTCEAQVVSPMNLITDSSKNTAISTTIPGLITEDNTPLIKGMRTASAMFGVETSKAIILLSDGYHNCPTLVSIGDPEVSNLIDQLTESSVRVFTIGFGLPTDVDHPLLQGFADATTPPGYAGSQFHDVTIPGFDPATWHPATELQATYKAILVDALGLEAATDPLDVINAGGKISREVNINHNDRRVSFFLSWVTPNSERLGLTVKASDNTVVPKTGSGIRFHAGKTYKILTLDRSFLQKPGKLGPNPWKIEIDAESMATGESEKFQYSVIMDSSLKMRTGFDKASYRTGDAITVTARLTEAGKPITGLNKVFVEVTRPGDGIGNWLTMNKVSPEELKEISKKRGTEHLSPVQQKGIILANIHNVPLPARRAPIILSLYDDGTHGDVKAGDGIYTNTFTNTVKEGAYSFNFVAEGKTPSGSPFERQWLRQSHVAVGVSSRNTVVTVTKLPLTTTGRIQLKLTIAPKDAYNNYLGPGYAQEMKLMTSKGEFVKELQDNLDGTYSTILQLPKGVDYKSVFIAFDIHGKKVSFNLGEKIFKR